jgi:hypothetical protein
MWSVAVPQIIVPYTDGGLRPQTQAFGEHFGARFVPMTSLTSYFDLLAELWAKQETFILCEQDVVPSTEVILSMAECSALWCSGLFAEPPPWAPRGAVADVSVDRRPYWSCLLGFNRFSAELQRRVPDAMARVGRLLPERFWPHLDGALIKVLDREERVDRHGHLPAVQHLHIEGPAPRVVGNLEAALQRVETSRLMLSAARTPADFEGFDSRTGKRGRFLDLLRPQPVDAIGVEGAESRTATDEEPQAVQVEGIDQPPGAGITRILVPHVAGCLAQETVEALTGCPAEFVAMTADDSYHRLVAGLWANGEGFITVEQDIVPTRAQMKGLITCPEAWCAFEYEYPPFGRYSGMGCAKFSSQLVGRFPEALSVTGRWHDSQHPPKHWCRVDGWLKRYLVERGTRQHIHGQVRHLHRGGPAHDCVVSRPATSNLI